MPKGRAIMIPLSDKTAGHGTHTLAAVWKQYLVELLQQTETITGGRRSGVSWLVGFSCSSSSPW